MSLARPIIETGRLDPVHLEKTRAKLYALVLLIVWLASVLYMGAYLRRGWVPHDEGTLGLSAERVLQGQLPHRDFDDYTGGLTFAHALAFRLFGINSVSMRYVLFAFFLPWVAALFYAASRFCKSYVAGIVTLVGVAWSVPHYPGPMPSWYNLFFATFGLAALLRYLEKPKWRWLFTAGLCGGSSILAKVTGAYFVAAVLLFFVFREQSISNEIELGGKTRARFYSGTVLVMLTLFLMLLFRMVHRVPGAGGLYFFVFPAVVLAGLLIARELYGIAGSNSGRFRTLLRMCIPFLAGIAVPCVLFVVPFAAAGAIHNLVQGLFATPARALRFATIAPLSPIAAVSAIPFLLPLLLAFDARGAARTIYGIALGTIGGAAFFLSLKHPIIYGIGWASLGTAVPLLSVVGTAIIWRLARTEAVGSHRQQQLMLLLCVTALCSLVQFPFSGQGYFLYVAPLVVLAASAVLANLPAPPRTALAALAGFYLLFGLFSVTPYHLGLEREPHARRERLDLPRAGGLEVESSAAQAYRHVIPLIESHAAGKFIYAAPDCPEVYFFSGRWSPSRHYFGYAESETEDGSTSVKRLEALGVSTVAINRDPLFSGNMSLLLVNELEKRYPNSIETEKFTVRWKD